jgi:hypothetical protein
MKGGAAVDEVERRFDRAMIGIYETAKRELNYSATRFLRMVSEHGGLVTARQLLWSDIPSDGFTTLWEHRRFDLTVEDHILRAEFASLFSDADREQALMRLKEYGWRPGRTSPPDLCTTRPSRTRTRPTAHTAPGC